MDSMILWSDDGAAAAVIQAFAGAMQWSALASIVLLVSLLIFFSSAIRRRRFWCALTRREVEVTFEEHGLPGVPLAVSVKCCSVFDPPSAVACSRRCADVAFRRQWPPALETRSAPR